MTGSSLKTGAAVDPITVEVIRSGLIAAAEEMRLAIVRTAYNPLIYEVQDFAVGLMNADGELLAQGTSLPIFLPCLSHTVRSGLDKFGSDGFEPGDILLANDPYSTGTHISDTSVYMPIFHDGELQGFSANTAHWADVGGKSPGGWCPDSNDVFQEGMIFPHLKIYEAGRVNRTMMDYISANNRFPELVRGDLDAQIAACKTGVKRYLALCEKYGADVVRDAMQIVFDQSEALMRRMIERMPDGEWSAETCMDHDGVVKDKRRKIKVRLEIAGDEVIVDFTGTDDTAEGPINCPLTASRAAAEIALKSATLPHTPANEGHSRALEIIAPEHTITNPSWPAPCDSYGYTVLIVIDLVAEALANVVPDRAVAGEYMLFGGWFFRTDPRHGKPFIFIDPCDGGGGAWSFDDGADALIFHGDGDAPNTPVEVAESRYPIRFDRYELHTEEYGIGKYRGGLGVIRDYRILTDHVFLQIANEQTVCRPHGLNGGREGGINRLWVRPGTEREEVITERVSFYGPLESGELVSARTAGGGGFGDPLERDPERVRREVLNEILTPEQAKELYGVSIVRDAHGDPVVDEARTAQLRGGS